MNDMNMQGGVSQLVGYIAGVCTTFSAVPQIIKCYRSKSTKDLSYFTLGMVESGVIMWAVYGGLDKDYPIIVWNVVSVIINTTLIVMKARYDKVVGEGGSGELETLPLTDKSCSG